MVGAGAGAGRSEVRGVGGDSVPGAGAGSTGGEGAGSRAEATWSPPQQDWGMAEAPALRTLATTNKTSSRYVCSVWCVVWWSDLRKYFPMSGLGCGDVGWLREILSAVRTELENDELELREVWKEREGLWNIREKKLCGAASSSDLKSKE